MTLPAGIWLFAACALSVRGQVQPAKDLQEALQTLGLTKFLQKLQETGLTKLLYSETKYTLFAPTNDAWERFHASAEIQPQALRDILLFHIAYSYWRADIWSNNELIPTALAGTNTRVNIYDAGSKRRDSEKAITISGAMLLTKNNKAGNGYVHVLNDVVFPLPSSSAYDVIAASPDVTRFRDLLDDTNMVKLLKYEEPLTIFAPTDEAFKKLPPAFINAVSTEAAALADLVNYHIVNGTFHTAGLMQSPRMNTLESGTIVAERKTNDGLTDLQSIRLNGEVSILRSLPCTNGVVHIVDTLLLPPAHPKQMVYSGKDAQRMFRR